MIIDKGFGVPSHSQSTVKKLKQAISKQWKMLKWEKGRARDEANKPTESEKAEEKFQNSPFLLHSQ